MTKFVTRFQSGVMLLTVILVTAPVLGFLDAPEWTMLPCMAVGVSLELYRFWVSIPPPPRAYFEWIERQRSQARAEQRIE